MTSMLLQAFFSGTAKMCVRELRSTEVPNVVVFYLAFISALGALVGTVIQVGPRLELGRGELWRVIVTLLML